MGDYGDFFLGMIFFMIFLAVYFVPTIVASSRNVKHLAGIIVLNIFLGFTLLGWVGALIWAVSDEKLKVKSSKRK